MTSPCTTWTLRQFKPHWHVTASAFKRRVFAYYINGYPNWTICAWNDWRWKHCARNRWYTELNFAQKLSTLRKKSLQGTLRSYIDHRRLCVNAINKLNGSRFSHEFESELVDWSFSSAGVVWVHMHALPIFSRMSWIAAFRLTWLMYDNLNVIIYFFNILFSNIFVYVIYVIYIFYI